MMMMMMMLFTKSETTATSNKYDERNTDYYSEYIHRIIAAVSSSSSSTNSTTNGYNNSNTSYKSEMVYKIDYNVLSVAAMTLALIMMVEYIRHRLDHWADMAAMGTTTLGHDQKPSSKQPPHHPSSTTTTGSTSTEKQPLYRAVLEGVYAELATLGIVEFVLHLIEEYYPSYDKARKSVFADVHFLLFYTALINALLSIVTAVLVTHVIVPRLWTRTELFEMNHYNEIQQTFVQIQNELHALHNHHHQEQEQSPNHNNNENSGNKDPQQAMDEASSPTLQQQQPHQPLNSDPEVGDCHRADVANNNDSNIWDDPWSLTGKGQKMMIVRGWYTSIMDHIRYPHIKYQYDTLLSQLRFHDLRKHVIDSYLLPKQIRISQYLIRCNEQTVLMKLIHVSSLAWLLLTGAICILYFVLGIVFYKFEDQTLIGTTLSYVYIGWMLSFVLICYILSNKMKSIFNTLLHTTELWDVTTSNKKEKERLAQQQLSLFWYSRPTIVIKLIQFMQFGYAASLSTLIVYWDNINDGSIVLYWYVITLIACYLLFIHTIVHAIPRYTLCTSLGQLVNHRYLRETVALYRLNEARQKEMERYYDAMNDNQPLHGDSGSTGGTNNNKYHLNSSIIVMNQDSVVAGNSSDPSNSETTLKSDATADVPPQSQFPVASNDRTTTTVLMSNDQVSHWLNGPPPSYDVTNVSTNVNSNENHVLCDRDLSRTDEKSSSFDDDILVTLHEQDDTCFLNGSTIIAKGSDVLLETIESNDYTDDDDDDIDVTRSVSQQQLLLHDMELNNSTGSNNHQPLMNLNDSRNHASMTIENLVSHKHKLCNDDDCDDDLFVSHSDNMQLSTPIGTASRQLPTNGSRRNLMKHQKRENIAVPTSNNTILHRICNFAHSYYTSERHIEISNVYGAIVAFFFVGQRVEGFIHSQEIVSSAFLSFHYRLDVTFWLLTTWLSMFIGASVLIIVLLYFYGDFQTTKGYKLGAAALIDFIISTVCLVLLLVAEMGRCCETSTSDATDKRYLSSFDDPGPIPCSCPQFGTRKYGGLGTIEPYVSLVFLRILRHWVARKMVKLLHRKYDWPKVKDDDDANQHEKHHLAKSTHQITDYGGQTMNHLNNVSIVTEMWEATIGAHPAIAAKHGEFSSEILRAMLGLSPPIADHAGISDVVSADSIDSDRPLKTNPQSKRQLFALQQRYSGLSPEAQEIILSGKLGRRMIQSNTSYNLEKTSSPVSRNSLTRNQSVMFEFDDSDSLRREDQNYNFISPHARLIHSVRRCDRKFLPFLDKWATVDVLITRFEVVYLEVGPDDTSSADDSANPDSIREALRATKGGKGLRLCDVAAGRRVTGRVGFADITCLYVARYLPYNDDDCDVDTLILNEGPTLEVESVEYWKLSSTRPSLLNSYNVPSRGQRWCHVKEDHLKIETASGTLMLRFFADLEDATQHPEHLSVDFESTGKLFQNNALQWVKSIANHCGPEQLTKQDMSHFGENTSDELRDYLVIIDRKVKRRHLRALSDGGDNMFSTRLSYRGISRPNLMQRMMSTRAISTASTVDRNVSRRFGAADASRNMNGEPSSCMLPTLGGNDTDTKIDPLPMRNRKVSFSQPDT